MKVLTFWVGWLAVGAGDVVVTGLLGMMAGVLFVVLAVWLAGRDDRVLAASGLLLGFGTTWLGLMGLQAANGGQLDDAAPWITFGVVLAALGVLAAFLRMARGGLRWRGAERV
jgi:uncharacterized membrane protein YfcA